MKFKTFIALATMFGCFLGSNQAIAQNRLKLHGYKKEIRESIGEKMMRESMEEFLKDCQKQRKKEKEEEQKDPFKYIKYDRVIDPELLEKVYKGEYVGDITITSKEFYNRNNQFQANKNSQVQKPKQTSQYQKPLIKVPNIIVNQKSTKPELIYRSTKTEINIAKQGNYSRGPESTFAISTHSLDLRFKLSGYVNNITPDLANAIHRGYKYILRNNDYKPEIGIFPKIKGKKVIIHTIADPEWLKQYPTLFYKTHINNTESTWKSCKYKVLENGFKFSTLDAGNPNYYHNNSADIYFSPSKNKKQSFHLKIKPLRINSTLHELGESVTIAAQIGDTKSLENCFSIGKVPENKQTKTGTQLSQNSGGISYSIHKTSHDYGFGYDINGLRSGKGKLNIIMINKSYKIAKWFDEDIWNNKGPSPIKQFFWNIYCK
ncbi:MAG: hypothetical protein U9R08_05480 [Nanoarchaeota archaeon]|nr:hypothetical protein [Nanoarchaeota archaeon]